MRKSRFTTEQIIGFIKQAEAGKATRGKNQTRAVSMLRDLIAENRRRVAGSGRDPEAARITMDAWRARMGNEGLN